MKKKHYVRPLSETYDCVFESMLCQSGIPTALILDSVGSEALQDSGYSIIWE